MSPGAGNVFTWKMMHDGLNLRCCPNFQTPLFNMKYTISSWAVLAMVMLILTACPKKADPPGEADIMQLISLKAGASLLAADQVVEQIPTDQPFVALFDKALDPSGISARVSFEQVTGEPVPFQISLSNGNRSLALQPEQELIQHTQYRINLSDEIKGANGETFAGIAFTFLTFREELMLVDAQVNGQSLYLTQPPQDVPADFTIKTRFSHPVDTNELKNHLTVRRKNTEIEWVIDDVLDNSMAFVISSAEPSQSLSPHTLFISEFLRSEEGNEFSGFAKAFYTGIDSTLKFPMLSEQELLTRIQEQTFRYFWDFGHPVSGLSRERNTSGDLVTSGGSGFGLMAILVGIERGFITRAEGLERIQKMVSFLAKADRFHGVWPHWLNGNTGKTIPFSPNDDGGDLVETSYLVMGLLTVRQYLNPTVPEEKMLIDEIIDLWETVEWDWHTQGGQEVLYWHWSPRVEWEKNLPIRGYNEALITYVLAASSQTHGISSETYQKGWARDGNMVNGNTFYGFNLPLGPDFGGPLFFSHYTFLGLDPRNLKDAYADYWQQGVNHTLMNREYCLQNPRGYIGYGSGCWGLTASDSHNGYSAHSPSNDLGVITPYCCDFFSPLYARIFA